MHFPRIPVCLGAVMGLLVALACGPSGPPVYEGHGVVRSLLAADRQIVIEHGEIPGLMPAMTMSFDVAEPGLLDDLRVGQEVDFHLQVSEKRYRIVAIAPHGQRRTNPGAESAPPSPSSLGAEDPAPDFRLVDQDGRSVGLADLRGQALVLDFVFTSCPGPCPILTSSHVALQRRLTPDERARTRFVSISLDPERDTPEALKQYGTARGADLSGWSFLTGPKEEVARVVKAYGVGTIRKPDGNIEHVVATFLIDGQGRIARRYLGLEHDPEEIQRDLARVLGSAG